MSKTGRPLKLTGVVGQAIVDGITQGLTLKAACKCAGISYSTLALWMAKAKRAMKQNEVNEYTHLMTVIKIESMRMWKQHRDGSYSSLGARDFRYGWQNPMREEVKQKLRRINRAKS